MNGRWRRESQEPRGDDPGVVRYVLLPCNDIFRDLERGSYIASATPTIKWRILCGTATHRIF